MGNVVLSDQWRNAWLQPLGPASLPINPLYVREKKIQFQHKFCTPPNPLVQSLVDQACLGQHHIDACVNILGFPEDFHSTYRFEYLINLAKTYNNLALSAEKDIINFKQNFSQGTLTLMDATQGISLARANTEFRNLAIYEALGHIDAARHQINAIDIQIVQVKKRLDDLDNFWGIFGIVITAIASTVAAAFTAGTGAAIAGAIAAAAGGFAKGANSFSGLAETEEGLKMQLERLEKIEKPAAQLQARNSSRRYVAALQEARIARMNAEYATERVKILEHQFINPQLWSALAQDMKEHYQTYLKLGMRAAWMAQRVLQFEQGHEPKQPFANGWPENQGNDVSGPTFIRFDYLEKSRQGLLAAEALQQDITLLEQKQALNEDRKQTITKVVSLGQRHPLSFASFSTTGELYFSTELEDLNRDYPGLLQARIRHVSVVLLTNVGIEGVKASLTHVGTSRVVVKQVNPTTNAKTFVEQTLTHPMVTALLSGVGQGGVGLFSIVNEDRQKRPFEGLGFAGNWVLRIPKSSNQIELKNIADIRLIIEYAGVFDDDYQKKILARPISKQKGMRSFSFKHEWHDAFFHLKDEHRPLGMVTTKDGETGEYTLKFETRASDFPPNELNLRITQVYLYIQNGETKKSSSKLKLYLSTKEMRDNATPKTEETTLAYPSTFKEAATPKTTEYDPGKNYLGRWDRSQLLEDSATNLEEAVLKSQEVDPKNVWYLHIPPKENKKFFKKGENDDLVGDFSSIEEVLFTIEYEYDPEKHPLAT
ncbi:MAG: hypothetical protein NPIRA03_06910 [Nitrospirales bacterium]|nr:MAG: hypothetical protein NPIRA03_06910 [Nitrospirales bacterium]